MMGRSISRNSLLLALFAVATALVISTTFLQTRDRIAQQQRVAEEKALLEILPQESHDNSLLDDTLSAPVGDELLRLNESRPIYRARREGKVTALIVPARASDGYSGAIDMIVGVSRDGSIAGVRVLNHRETPGLGDKIERRKSDWITDFKGHSLANTPIPEWAVKKEGGAFDQFTGATITPRAVINATRRALEFVAQERALLFDIAAPETPPATQATANLITNAGAAP
ncbi:MAG: electron transport complex subunit RsxG [Chromatocurvus sp.]